MYRLPVVSLLFAASVYGGTVGGPVNCGAGTTPTFTLMVNSTSYTNFNMEGSSSSGCTVGGTFGSIATTGYVVTITGFTKSDPVIDFGMDFSGSSDPAITLMISTPYTGGPFPNLFTTTWGTLTDSDGNGTASAMPLAGSDIVLVKVNNIIVPTASPQAPGCSFSGQAALFSQACPSSSSQVTSGSFPSSGTLEVDAVFNLSAGDSYNINGSAGFDPTPEPGSGVLMVAGLVSVVGLARRRFARQ